MDPSKNEFVIILSAGNGNKKPFPSAYRKKYVQKEKLFCKTVEELYSGKEYYNMYPIEWEKWEDVGFGHRIDDDGFICRFVEKDEWFICFNDVAEILDFLKNNKGKLEVYNDQPIITLYKNEVDL